MKKITARQILLSLLLCFYSLTSFAWNHSVELGYGFSHDPNHTKYNNSGVLLSGDILPLNRSPWYFLSITGSLGQWYTSAPVNKNLTTAAVSLALRLYAFNIQNRYPAYGLLSFGPAWLSNRQFGLNTQARNITIQSNLGLGAEFNCIDLNLRFAHYSNANTSKPNEGFNVLYLLSIGYLF